jgi:ribose 5-phosphate isomerase
MMMSMVMMEPARSMLSVGDEASDRAVDEVADVVGLERIGLGSRRTPPALMLRWMLPIARSIPPCKPEKAEHEAKGCGVNSKDPKKIESSKIGDDGADEVDADADVPA